ncbi:Archaetidylserine synthase [uncultured archaeon]|nr:Archaetidylserine synthase [uncultured archaeon]
MIKILSLADIITIINAVLGFLALLMVFSNQIQIAASLILLGLLTDGLDGVVARRMRKSRIGEYLEAIADMVSLSIAPLALLYKIYYDTVFSQLYLQLLFAIVLVFSLICSIIRLSSFSFFKQKQFFFGLPTSASAIFLVLIAFFKPDIWYILPIIIILSLAMISSILFPKPGLKVNLMAAIFILATILLDGMYLNIAPLLLLTALMCYIIFGPIYLQFKRKRAGIGVEDTHN